MRWLEDSFGGVRERQVPLHQARALVPVAGQGHDIFAEHPITGDIVHAGRGPVSLLTRRGRDEYIILLNGESLESIVAPGTLFKGVFSDAAAPKIQAVLVEPFEAEFPDFPTTTEHAPHPHQPHQKTPSVPTSRRFH